MPERQRQCRSSKLSQSHRHGWLSEFLVQEQLQSIWRYKEGNTGFCFRYKEKAPRKSGIWIRKWVIAFKVEEMPPKTHMKKKIKVCEKFQRTNVCGVCLYIQNLKKFKSIPWIQWNRYKQWFSIYKWWNVLGSYLFRGYFFTCFIKQNKIATLQVKFQSL